MYLIVLIVVAVLSPLVFLLPCRMRMPYAAALMVFSALIGIWQAVMVFYYGHPVEYSGFDNLISGPVIFRLDRLSAYFTIVISLAAISVALYARAYIKAYKDKFSSSHIALHQMALVLLTVSMLSVTGFQDAFGFLFAWELMTVSSFLLILFDAGRREVRRAALAYLVIMHVGFVFLLAGFTLISSAGFTASFDSIALYAVEGNLLPLFVLFLLGFGMKAGLFPLHTWLPEAHPAAPSHVSAFMSGVMIKMGVYGVVRVMSLSQPQFYNIGLILLCVGVVTAMWGAILAAVQNDMKRLLAYSSIENVGIIFVGLGASALGYHFNNPLLAVLGMGGALLHVLNHSFFKTALFFGAGNVLSAVHTTSLDALGGLSRQMPVTTVAFLTATIAIAALPPLNGFVSEFMIYSGMYSTFGLEVGGDIPSMCGIVALALTGGVVLLAFTKLFGVVFLGSPRTHVAEHAREMPLGRLAAFIIPVAGIITVGFAAGPFAGFVSGLAADLIYPEYVSADHVYGTLLRDEIINVAVVSPWKYMIVPLVLVVIAGGLMMLRRRLLRNRMVEKSPVWGCGFTSASHKMQYSGESYSEGLYGISTSLTRNTGKGDVVDKDEIFPTRHSFDLKHKDRISSVTEKWWLDAVRRLNVRVMRFNTGKVNHYVLYALLFLILILILTLTGII